MRATTFLSSSGREEVIVKRERERKLTYLRKLAAKAETATAASIQKQE